MGNKIAYGFLALVVAAVLGYGVIAVKGWLDARESRDECARNGGYVVDGTSVGSVCVKDNTPTDGD